MKMFQLDRINKIAPYEVKVEGKQYVFDTAQGLRYEVRFFEEQPIGGCETWQFSFAKANSEPAPEDPYVRFTLFAIIDEFFHENEDVLLYICDTSDNREAARNRLFIRWFKQSAQPDRFTIRSAKCYHRGPGFLRCHHRGEPQPAAHRHYCRLRQNGCDAHQQAKRLK